VSTTLNIQESPDLESTRSGAGQTALATLLFGGSCDPRESFRLSSPETAQPTEHSLARCGVNPSATEQRHAAAEAEVEFARAAPSDRPAIEAMLARCSAKSLSDRFFRPISTAPDGYLDQVLSHDDIYFVFVVRRDDAVIGLAELHRTAPLSGELALIVEDAFQQRGIGTAAFGLLTEVASRLDMQTLTADVRIENGVVLRSLRRAGKTTVTRARDIFHVQVQIESIKSECPLTGSLC
jgi:RimJ/RimL family protein N-acetyltransferase